MNVLFCYTPHNRLLLMANIQLEILLKHLDEGDNICFYTCKGELIQCEFNPNRSKYKCAMCKDMQKRMLAALSKKGNITVRYYDEKKVELSGIRIDSVECLKHYRYKDMPVGIGAASSLITRLRDHDFDTYKYEKSVERELKLACQVLDSFINQINDSYPDLVYVFNGRFSSYSPIVSYCRACNIHFKTYEFSSRVDSYNIVNNEIPHNIDYTAIEIDKAWNNEVDEKLKNEIGCSFYENTRKGISLLEHSFIAMQKEGELPVIDKDKEIITFFNSSIDEFASVPGWEKSFLVFDNEVELIWKICSYFADDASKLFILRIHPNLKYLNNTQIRDLERLKVLSNLIIVQPESSISSYSLIDISKKVVTFGSTIGIEATYLGIPSISLGLNFYMNLNVVYMPKTENEVYKLINDKQLLPKSRLGAIKFGYWWLTFGEKITYRDKEYTTLDLLPSTVQQLFIFVLKLFSIDFVRRVVRIFKPVTWAKMKDPYFRRAIYKEVIPWEKQR